jgi:IS30 family transposase
MGEVAKCYRQLDAAQREEISLGLARGLLKAEIARKLGCDRSTIGREVKRHTVEGVGYRGHWAQMQIKAPNQRGQARISHK